MRGIKFHKAQFERPWSALRDIYRAPHTRGTAGSNNTWERISIKINIVFLMLCFTKKIDFCVDSVGEEPLLYIILILQKPRQINILKGSFVLYQMSELCFDPWQNKLTFLHYNHGDLIGQKP